MFHHRLFIDLVTVCSQIKEVRGIMIAGGADYDEFFQLLRQLEPCFMLSIKDLRSQVVREACITTS